MNASHNNALLKPDAGNLHVRFDEGEGSRRSLDSSSHSVASLPTLLNNLLVLGVWVAQIVSATHLKMETGAVVFGLGNIVTNFLLIAAVWLLSRIERGYSVTLDHWPAETLSPEWPVMQSAQTQPGKH